MRDDLAPVPFLQIVWRQVREFLVFEVVKEGLAVLPGFLAFGLLLLLRRRYGCGQPAYDDQHNQREIDKARKAYSLAYDSH
jgi:hypothetical protein